MPESLDLREMCEDLLETSLNTKYFWIRNGEHVYELEVIMCKATHEPSGTEVVFRKPTGQYFNAGETRH